MYPSSPLTIRSSSRSGDNTRGMMTWLRNSGVFSCFKTLFRVFNCPESKAKLSRTEGLVVVRRCQNIPSKVASKGSFRLGIPRLTPRRLLALELDWVGTSVSYGDCGVRKEGHTFSFWHRWRKKIVHYLNGVRNSGKIGTMPTLLSLKVQPLFWPGNKICISRLGLKNPPISMARDPVWPLCSYCSGRISFQRSQRVRIKS